jgi:hypothetical protein
MLATATAYTDVRAVVPRGTSGPHIQARHKAKTLGEREMVIGEYAKAYFQRCRARTDARIRMVARKWHDAKPRYSQLRPAARESEMELSFAVDVDTFWGWYMKEGPGFWSDKSSLKALKRDNPDMCIFV